MSKHTPGSWAAHHHENTDTYTIHVAGKSWESWAVAHVGDCTQDEANARLIAAAPDLLHVVSELLDYAENATLEDDDEPPIFRAARAALARATGDQTVTA